MHRKACIAQLEKHINSQEPWFLATKNLWSRSVTISYSQEKDLFETADGVPQGDPLSTLVFDSYVSITEGHPSEQGSGCVYGCVC